jgi:hypothetical protein
VRVVDSVDGEKGMIELGIDLIDGVEEGNGRV